MNGLASLTDLNDSLEMKRCTTRMDSSNAQKWKEEIDEVSDIVKLLDEETFDFDLSVSPESGPSKPADDLLKLSVDEEEIFFGPVCYKEICVATAVNEEEKVAEKFKPLSPLTATEMAKLCQEAFTVSCRIRLAMGTSELAVTGLPSSSPALTFSPLDEALSNFSKILPAEKRLSCDENGVIKFQGSQSKEPLSISQTAEKKPLRQSVSRLGLNSHDQPRLARRSFLQRSNSVRQSGDTVQKPSISAGQSSCLSDSRSRGDQTAAKSPVKKQFCTEMQEAADISDNLSSAADLYDSSTLNQFTGKRQLPAPKTKVSSVSRLPQWSCSRPLHLNETGSTSSSAVQFTAAVCSAAGDASMRAPTGLQRSNSLHLGRPNFQFPRPDAKVPSSFSTSAEDIPQSASKIMPSKLDFIGATTSQCKILTALRSHINGSSVSQGPVKAVGPKKGTDTTVLAQDTTGFQMKNTASAGNTTPKKNSGTHASVGGTTPSFISRTRPGSGLPTPSKLKVPEFSRPVYKY